MLEQLVSLMGAGMILGAYAGQQLKKLNADGLLYIVLNLIGGTILSVVAYRVHQTGLTLVEVCWTVISALALIRYFQRN